METLTPIAKQLLKSPGLVLQIEQIQQLLSKESEQRKLFREWIDDSQKAEFINGEIIMHSPVKWKHWVINTNLSSSMEIYANIKDLGEIGFEKVMIALTRNDYEPDICFFSKEKASKFTPDQMLFPAPDLVVEILSKRTAKKDKGIKKEDYALHGVKEYWIIDPDKQTVEQYLLPFEDATEYFKPYIWGIDEDIESKTLTGFKIPVRAIFDKKLNGKVLQELIKQ